MKPGRHVSFVAAVALLVSAIAGILPLAAGVAQTPAAETEPFTVTILLEDIRFDPATLEIPANQDVIIRVENTGAALHDFVVPALGIAVDVGPGETAEVTVNAWAGKYPFLCSVPGHKEAGMVGTLRVVSGLDVAASSAEMDAIQASVEAGSPAESSVASPVANPILSPDESPVAAMDAPGCEGLAGYSRQVLAIETESWNQMVAEFGIDEVTDLFFLEGEQYAGLATMLDSNAALLMQVEAPGFAEDWHQNKIASKQLGATTARMALQAGNLFAAELMLWEVDEILIGQNRQAYLDAVAVCPAFETFWNEWDLIDDDAGTPPDASSDYSSCAGLAPYDSNYRRAAMQALAHRPDLAEAFFEFSEGSEDDLRARTPTELLALAAVFQEFSGEIAKVTPPDYATEWHLSQIMYYGAIADFLKAAAAHGFEDAEAEFAEQFGLVGILGDAAAEEATEECAVFYEFATS